MLFTKIYGICYIMLEHNYFKPFFVSDFGFKFEFCMCPMHTLSMCIYLQYKDIKYCTLLYKVQSARCLEWVSFVWFLTRRSHGDNKFPKINFNNCQRISLQIYQNFSAKGQLFPFEKISPGENANSEKCMEMKINFLVGWACK